jgi:hypothetical protein
MTLGSTPSGQRRGTLLVADISNYTGFLQGVADAHVDLIVEADTPPAAYGLLSTMLDSLVTEMIPTYRLAKLEGDAVFVVADEGTVDGARLLDDVRGWYASFHRVLVSAGEQWTCTCAACALRPTLDLKFVVHHGGYVAQSIAGHDEVLGPNVNIVHRLLKNHAHDLIGPSAYALFSDAAIEALGIPTDGLVAGHETYPDTPDIPVHVLALQRPA